MCGYMEVGGIKREKDEVDLIDVIYCRPVAIISFFLCMQLTSRKAKLF